MIDVEMVTQTFIGHLVRLGVDRDTIEQAIAATERAEPSLDRVSAEDGVKVADWVGRFKTDPSVR